MEGRMTVCNMAIEMGAKGGMIAPDQTTFDYLKGRQFSPQGADWDAAVAYWQTLKSDPDAKYDAEIIINAADIAPQVTGHQSRQVIDISGPFPHRRALPTRWKEPRQKKRWRIWI